MAARDLTSGKVTSPVPYRKNPDYKKDDGSPEFLPAEPHIGISGVNDEAPAPTYQTGIVRGGTTNPPKGQSGDVERVGLKPGDVDPYIGKLEGGDYAAFDKQADGTESENVAIEDIEGDSKSKKK